MKVGVLALQGAFRAHIQKLEQLDVDASEVRTPSELDDVDALVLPGGESTTMSMLIRSNGLEDGLRQRLAEGMPTLGTCAGLILLSSEIADGRDDQITFGALDVDVQRNGYGTQRQSAETSVATTFTDERIHAVFIRAPRVVRCGETVEVLADAFEGDPVLVRSGPILGAAFHPELSGDDAVHRLFVEIAA